MRSPQLFILYCTLLSVPFALQPFHLPLRALDPRCAQSLLSTASTTKVATFGPKPCSYLALTPMELDAATPKKLIVDPFDLEMVENIQIFSVPLNDVVSHFHL